MIDQTNLGVSGLLLGGPNGCSPSSSGPLLRSLRYHRDK